MLGEFTHEELRDYAVQRFGDALTPQETRLFVVSLSAFIVLDLVRGNTYLSVAEAHRAALQEDDRFAGVVMRGRGTQALPAPIPANSYGG